MTTNAGLHISADEYLNASDEAGALLGFERVQVSFPAEESYNEEPCKHCGRELYEDDDNRWTTDEDGVYCPDAEMVVCPTCGGLEDVDTCEACEGLGEVNGPHEPETGPGTWCNSAAITVDEEENSVTLSISLGDPRGAFTMTVRKVDRSGYCKLCGRAIRLMPTTPEATGHVGLVYAHEHNDVAPCDPSATWDPDTNTAIPDGEQLIMHVPYPGQSWQHMPLTLLQEGTYLIGN